MTGDHIERDTSILSRIEGLEPVRHAMRLPAGGEPVAVERLAAGEIRPVAEAFAAPRRRRRRVAGRWGAVARVLVGAGLMVLAFAYWRAGWRDVLIGLVALPAAATALMSLRDRAAPPLRLGAAGHVVTLAHIAVTVILFGDAAALFYGGMTLVAGLQSNGGCEITTLANRLRGRDDQVGCPIFAPFDALDRELARRRS